MAFTIGTNIGPLWASVAIASHQRRAETAMARLSTGSRLMSAADDPAGIAIGSRLNSDIRGTGQAIRNALDGKSLISTAEGAHSEIENILQRMREVAVQAANDTNDAQDRTNLNEEMKALSNEIDRIDSATTWAGQNLMSANSSVFLFQVGTSISAKNSISLAIGSMSASALLVTPSAVSVTGAEASLTVLSAIDAAMARVNTQRANLGAMSNRLSYTMNNLTNVSSNLTSALGRIQDADFAAEAMALAKHQILQQSALTMLANTIASQRSVLVLLNIK